MHSKKIPQKEVDLANPAIDTHHPQQGDSPLMDCEVSGEVWLERKQIC
jgi:hypothetical protein